MGAHIVNGQFKSDKYKECPAGNFPMSLRDKTAQDLIWEYAQRRRVKDTELSDDLEMCLHQEGYEPHWLDRAFFTARPKILAAIGWATAVAQHADRAVRARLASALGA